MKIAFSVNGENYERRVEATTRLLDLLREDLQLTGTKEGCGEGECGSCTVLVDGKAVYSCLMLAPQADGKEITTIEALSNGNRLHPIQQAFVDKGAVQCGFCTPGFIMSVYGLLMKNSNPTEEEILTALEGNLCRCTGYIKIVEAAKHAVRLMNEVE